MQSENYIIWYFDASNEKNANNIYNLLDTSGFSHTWNLHNRMEPYIILLLYHITVFGWRVYPEMVFKYY